MRITLLGGFLLLGLSCQVVWASSDFACMDQIWSVKKLRPAAASACNGLAFLSPSNPVQVNLQLLMMDVIPPQPAAAPMVVPFETQVFASLLPDVVIPPTAQPPVAPVRSPTVLPPSDPSPATAVANPASVPQESERSRCASNASGTAALIQALQADTGLSASERTALALLRRSFRLDCSGAQAKKSPPAAQPLSSLSVSAQAFEHYLVASQAFYDGQWSLAETRYQSLLESHQPWVREVSSYMLARSFLVHSRAMALDDYGYFDATKVDMTAVRAARRQLLQYLCDYPDGRYAVSAKGLMRRVYVLNHEPTRLAQEYEWLLSHPFAGQTNISPRALLVEAAHMLPFADPTVFSQTPLLLATSDLRRMLADNPITLEQLQAQRAQFQSQPALYRYLLAAWHVYVEPHPSAALALLPEHPPAQSMNYLGFSQQMLRGLALEDSGAWAEARALWRRLLPFAQQAGQRSQLELALALNEERHGDLARVLASDSPIQTASYRARLLRYAASPALLRRYIQTPAASPSERQLAASTLLTHDLARAHYQAFIADRRALPAVVRSAQMADYFLAGRVPNLSAYDWPAQAMSAHSYACPGVDHTLARLVRAPQNLDAQLCLGDYLLHYRSVLGSSTSGVEWQPSVSSSDLGGTGRENRVAFPSAQLDVYQQIIANPQASRQQKAYALYRAIQCYAPAGHNTCSGAEVQPAVRKQWYRELKSRYGASRWARGLHYYW